MGFIRKPNFSLSISMTLRNSTYNVFYQKFKAKLKYQFTMLNIKTLKFEEIAIKSLFKTFKSFIELYSMFFSKVAIKEINYSANYLLFVFQYKPTTFVSAVWKRIGTLQSGKTTKVVALCC